MTRINGLATALPAHSMPQVEYCVHAERYSCRNDRDKQVLKRLYSRTDIASRSSALASPAEQASRFLEFYPDPIDPADCGPGTATRMELYNQFANQLSLESCRQALRQAATTPQEITHLITVSCTGFNSPGFDLNLLRVLGMNPNVFRTHIGFMGCHGTMNALRVAQGFLAGDNSARILLCATEICSIHFQYGRGPDNLVANALFADGSAALVISNAPGKFTYSSSRSSVIANSENAMSWRIGDNGFSMTLSSEVPELIDQHLPSFIQNWLAEKSLTVADIESWAVHPGGPRVLDAVERSLNLSPAMLSASRDILSECGNMSSPTILFVIEKLIAQKRRFPCILLAFGPGLTIEAALLV